VTTCSGSGTCAGGTTCPSAACDTGIECNCTCP
jgi:hypothetical protein